MGQHLDRQLAAVMFADIVGYTALMQEDEHLGLQTRAKYASVIEAQHEAFGGRIVQYYGDGALTMFPNSVDAVLCAIQIQKELSQPLEVSVRIGIHVGNVIVEPTGLIGDAVNIASRIESFAIPGGVLVSDSVHDQVKNQQQLGFVNLGKFKLKNVGRPFEIFAVSTEGLGVPAADFLQGKGERFASLPSNLPDPGTPLLGRDADISLLVDLLERHRVVTVTGPGGAGKTRTAIEVCHRLASRFLDGIAFVPMAAVTDVSDFMPALAEALSVKEAEGRSQAEGIVALITEKKALLLLDNLEQVVSAAPEIAALVSKCPGLRILTTSRTPLRIDAERQYALGPLAIPPPEDEEALESTMAYPGIALFVERAKEAKGSFELTAESAPTVVAVCRRLDGLPLAIELAAARIRLLSPEALLQRLDHALEVLTSGMRDRPDRQQTLRATIDWSHSLLTSSEKRLFRRMAVFPGGCSLEGIEAVCSEGSGSVLDGLGSLVDMGLVQTAGHEDRFQMLQTIREYALEELQAAGETDDVGLRHAAHFAKVAGELRSGIEGYDQVGSIERGVLEDADLRAGLDFLLNRAKDGDSVSAERGLQMCGDLWFYWHIRSKHLSARDYVRGFLDSVTSDVPTLGRSNALRSLGLASSTLGHFEEAIEQYLESYRVAQELNGDHEMALAALLLGIDLLTVDMDRAFEWSREAIDRSRAQNYKSALGFALTFDGILHAVSGDAATAESRYDEALAIQRSLDDKEGSGLSLGGLAQLASLSGDLKKAIGLYQESLVAFEAIGDRAEEARILSEMAWTHLSLDDPTAARRFFLDSAQAYVDVGSVRGVGTSMIGLAAVEVVEGQPLLAVQIAAAAEVFTKEEGIVNVYSEDTPGREYVERAQAELPASDFRNATEKGRTMSVKEAFALARVAEPAMD
ncbi:MAG: tetratricopeptide repeat protein [Actinomycetota bacterium]|nr:tetratricopeptide repeat protein [Actinomycetota bacterium]